MNYAIVGYGRMGEAIETQAAARGHRRVVVIDPARDDSAKLDADGLRGAEVAFEFTTPAVAHDNLVALLDAGVPVICGTTGWQPTPALQQALERSRAGIVCAPNFSVGMNLFMRVAEHAARMFGLLGFHEPYVHEVHHRAKHDVPSGTARRLAEILVAADPRLDSALEGNPEHPLPPGTLHVSSTRVGADPGAHTVGFDGPQDVITLRHVARSREGFALGAVLAGEWLGERRGFHTFDEVLDGLLEAGRGDGAPAGGEG